MLEVDFCTDPESQKKDGRVRFRDVKIFRDERTGEGAPLPLLIGILVKGTSGGTRYTLTTETSETSVFTTARPEIIFS
jgi:hypothetical protein